MLIFFTNASSLHPQYNLCPVRPAVLSGRSCHHWCWSRNRLRSSIDDQWHPRALFLDAFQRPEASSTTCWAPSLRFQIFGTTAVWLDVTTKTEKVAKPLLETSIYPFGERDIGELLIARLWVENRVPRENYWGKLTCRITGSFYGETCESTWGVSPFVTLGAL